MPKVGKCRRFYFTFWFVSYLNSIRIHVGFRYKPFKPNLATTSTASSVQQVSKQVSKRPVSEQAICSDQIVEEVDKVVQVLYQLGQVSAIVVAATVTTAVWTSAIAPSPTRVCKKFSRHINAHHKLTCIWLLYRKIDSDVENAVDFIYQFEFHLELLHTHQLNTIQFNK